MAKIRTPLKCFHFPSDMDSGSSSASCVRVPEGSDVTGLSQSGGF